MKKSGIHNPHDKLFRASLQHKEVAREFLEMHLPDSIKNELDLTSITYCNTSFIDEQLKLSQSDVLFETKISGKSAYIYVLAEHQFKIDKFMPFRLMKYMVSIWDFHIKQSGKKHALPLPMIYPLVFFTGKGPYTGDRTLWDLCGENAEKMQGILSSPFHLVDVNAIPEDELTSHVWAGTLGFIMRQHFKRHLSEEIKKIVSNLNTIEINKQGQYVVELIKYILNIDDDHRDVAELVELMHDNLSPDVEKEIMTLAERIEEKGMEKGRIEANLASAKKMIAEGVDPNFIAKFTELSLAQIKKLQQQK